MLGDNIRKLRILNSLTLQELSKLSGVGVSTISEIEVGKILNPRTTTLNKIAKALDIDINVLLGKDNRANKMLEGLDDPEILETLSLYLKLDDEYKKIVDNLIKSLLENK
ncbi:helix-turn-helix transcriptional regulator [Clostridium perfringens]|nr:helix-turn-helix transcriptional regulator [Clostridium perfringens]